MNLTAFTFQTVVPLAAGSKNAFEIEPFMYLGGGIVTLIVGAFLMLIFIYYPVQKKLKNVKPDKPTPFLENEHNYTQYLVWVSQNGLSPHFLKREVDINAIYGEDEE